jgi:hypothetical protein
VGSEITFDAISQERTVEQLTAEEFIKNRLKTFYVLALRIAATTVLVITPLMTDVIKVIFASDAVESLATFSAEYEPKVGIVCRLCLFGICKPN